MTQQQPQPQKPQKTVEEQGEFFRTLFSNYIGAIEHMVSNLLTMKNDFTILRGKFEEGLQQADEREVAETRNRKDEKPVDKKLK